MPDSDAHKSSRKAKLDWSLLKEAKDTRESERGLRSELPCALKSKCMSCAGKGYIFSPSREFARATLCSCVRQCPACLGRACREDPLGVRPCRSPHIVNVIGLLNAAHIPSRYADASFAGFCKLPGRDPETIKLLSTWRNRFFHAKGRGLVITGPVGVGKTYLLAAIAKEVAEQGKSVRFTDFFQLQFDLRAGFSEGKSDSALLGPLADFDVLIIDELGKGRNRDYDKMILDQLISTRYAQMKTLIASTNYRLSDGSLQKQPVNIKVSNDDHLASKEFDLDQFTLLESRIGSRIFSRMREMTDFVTVNGADHRLQRSTPTTRP